MRCQFSNDDAPHLGEFGEERRQVGVHQRERLRAVIARPDEPVAKRGGWPGRRCAGPPGWGSIWPGYQRLADLVLGVGLAEAIPAGRDPSIPVRCG